MKNDNVTIFIFGAGSRIARETFKKFKDYNIVGFSKYSKISEINEYKVLRFKNINFVKKTIEKTKSNKIVLVFMETLSIPNLIINKSQSELEREIKSNLLNPHNIIKKILPVLIKKNWGRIILCGSSGALSSSPGISGYSLSKHGLLGYNKILSKEYASLGITSNYLSLGVFKSPLSAKVNRNYIKKLLSDTDTKNYGDYSSVANAIDFIIKSDYVTGSIIPVDGGYN